MTQATLPTLRVRRCKAKSYVEEATARRCLWAMTVRGFDTNKMTVNRCACGAWHVGRKK